MKRLTEASVSTGNFVEQPIANAPLEAFAREKAFCR
jgi:hypothetical protein